MSDPQALRTCKQCGESKPLEQYPPSNTTKKSGERSRHHTCYVCRRVIDRTRYHADPIHRAKRVILAMNAQHRHQGQRLPVEEAAQMLLAASECAYCGQPNDGSVTFALDHIQPVKLGGTNTMDNVTPCCEPCNRAKHDMPAADYIAWLQGVVRRNAS